MAFDLLWWFDAKTKKQKTKKQKKKQKQKNKTKNKTKNFVCLIFFNILEVIKVNLGSRDLLFL